MKRFKSQVWKRFALFVLGLVVAVLGYGGLQLVEPVAIAQVSVAPDQFSFTGRALLVASDADMVATAYADAKLNRVEGVNDALTVIPLPLNPDNPALATVPVSVVPLRKGWRKSSHLLSLQFLPNLLVVMMDEVPDRANVIL